MTTPKAQFWNAIAAKYAASPVADTESYEYKLARIGEQLHAGMTVLEMGCGTGSTAIILAQRFPHVEFVAEDYSQAMIDIAKAKLRNLDVTNLTFNCSCAGQGALEQQRFDMVIAMNLVHLVPHWQDLVQQVAKQLKPGGWWVSSQFCLGEMPIILKPLLAGVLTIGQWLNKVPAPIHFLKVASYRQAIGQAGLEIKFAWHPHGRAKVPFIMAQKAS